MKNSFESTTMVAKRSILNFCCIFLLVVTGVKTQAQTNPTPQNLTYSQNFGTTTFNIAPTGMAAWTVASSPRNSQSNAESSSPNGNASITAATSAQLTGGCYGYSTSSNGKFYIQTSSNSTNGTNQLATAFVATNLQNIKVSYDVEMISAQPKTIGVILQYRIGTSGSWTTISGSAYAHNNSSRSAGQVDNFVELNLPSDANNEAVVQLRWATWRGTESGNSSGISIDNISITGNAIPSLFYFRSAQTGNWNTSSSWQMSTDNSNWVNATFTPNYLCKDITIQSNHHVTITVSDTIDQVVVNGTLTYGDNSGNVLTINNETGIDLTINGTFEDFGPSSIVWVSGSKWEIGSSGTLIKTRSTSSNNWRDYYNDGISNIPATANWIIRKIGSDNPSVSSTGGMYYPNLIIENNTASTWTTGSSSSFTGSSDYPRVKGNLHIGGTGTGDVSFMSDNTNTNAVLVQGELTVKSGSTLRNNGTGFEVQGNLNINGSVSYEGNEARKLIVSGNIEQNIAGSGTFNIYDFITNKTSNHVILDKSIKIDHQLSLTNGHIILGTNDITIDTNTTINGGDSVSYLVTNSTGKIIKNYANTGTTFIFPTGDNTYFTPFSLTLNAATLESNSSIAARVISSSEEPHVTGYADYATRYWDVNSNNISDINVDVNYTYVDNDIVGDENSFVAARWNNDSYLKKIGTVNTSNKLASANDITEIGNFTIAGICYFVADAGNDTVVAQDTPVQIGSSPESGFTYLWSPATGLSDHTIANPFAFPTSTTTYTLKVSDSTECVSTGNLVVLKLSLGPITTCAEKLIYHPFNGININDSIVVSIQLPSGVTAIDSAYISPSYPNIVVDNSDGNNPTYTFVAPDSSFTLNYYIKAACETFKPSTNSTFFVIHDTINGVYNSFTTDTILINSPWIIFDNPSSTNLTYINAFIDSNYTRTFAYKNTGAAFTGELLFLDTIPNFNSAAIQFVSAVVDSVTSGTVSITSSMVNDSVVQLKISMNNFASTGQLFINETIKLIDCPNGTNNLTYFSAFYGCADDTLCAEAISTVPSTTTNEDVNDKPVLDYTLLTKGYPDCWKDAQERIIRINNTGLSDASEVQLWFLLNGSVWLTTYITENNLDSFEIYYFDGITKTPISFQLDSVSINGYDYVTITTLEPLAAGDSLFFRYYEHINCIDSTNYDDYFNNTIGMHYEGFPRVELIHKCNSTGLHYINEYPQNQYGWVTWEHPSNLQQTFYNYIGTMNGGDSANFEVTSSNLVVAGIYGTNTSGFIFNINNSEIQIELQLDSALGLVTDSIYLFGNIGGIPTAIYADSIEYFLGLDSLIGGGDKIIVHFAIPDSFYVAATPQPYMHGIKYLPTSYYKEFFYSFKVKFRLRAYCEYMSGAPSAIVQRFFFVPDKSCSPDCKLPLAKVEDAINVHCPGCLFPGWNISAFDIQRTNFGFADDNNNNFPDSYPLQPADTNLVKIKNVMLRDTLECTFVANTSDGEDLLMFDNIGVDYKYAQLLLQNSRMENLKFLGATGTFTDSNGVYNFTVPDYAGISDSNNFYLDLSIDSLKVYSGDTSLTQFWIGNDITIKPTFAVVENFTNPYFNIEPITSFLFMAGTPFTGVMIKPDAFNYEIDSLSAMSDSLRSELSFWCTGYEGRYTAIGTDYEFIIPMVNHNASGTQNFYPCKNVLRYNMNTEVGSTVLPYEGNNQAAWNSFSYELRNLWMLDSIQISYPNGYLLDSVVVINSQLTSDGLGGNTVRSCYQWVSEAYHDYDLTDAIINPTSATIYPARNLTQLTADVCDTNNTPRLRGWDEAKRYYMVFILKNTVCDTPLVYQTAGNYPITTYWSDFPTATNGDTVIVQTLGAGEFNKPDAGLTTSINTFTQDAPNSDLMMNITVNTIQTTSSTDSITHSIAENTFFIIHSPSGNVVVDSIVDITSNQQIYALNFLNNDSLYGLGNVGYYWGAANFNVFAHYNCANIDVSDSILIYTGWNCNGYPDSLQPLNTVCYLDSQWRSFTIIKPGLQASLQVADTANICDTLHYDIKLTATGAGRLDSVNVWMPTSSMFSYLSGSGQLIYNGDTIVTPTGVDTLLFDLSNTGILTNFEQGDTAHFIFDILPTCGFYTSNDEVKVFVTATNYCGNRLDTIFLGERPEFTQLPLQDSIIVELLSDTISGCDEAATINLMVTNLGANPTGSTNTLTIELPSGFTWASGDTASVVIGQTYTFGINGGITNGATQTIQFVTADVVGNGIYNMIANIWVNQKIICGADTCTFVQSFAEYTDTAQIVVINRDLTVNNSINDASCFGSENGDIDITVTGGTTPYTYSWVNAYNVSYGTSEDLLNVLSGTYTVTVTDSTNCIISDNISIGNTNAIDWPYHPVDGTDKQRGTSVAVDSSGNVYAVGYFQGDITLDSAYTTNGNQDMYMVKFDECGTILWSKQLGGTGADYATKVLVDNAGDVLLTGYFMDTVNFGGTTAISNGNSDLFVAKYRPDGALLWVYTYGTPTPPNIIDVGNDVTVDDSNNVYVVGTVGAGVLGDVYVLKLDENGNYVNQKIQPTSAAMGIGITYCATCSTNAKILVTGKWFTGDIFIGKLDTGLITLVPNFYLSGVGQRIVTDSNFAYVVGYKYNGAYQQIEVIKADLTNFTAYTEITAGSATGTDVGTDIQLDPDGNIFITGQFTSDTIQFPITTPDVTLVNTATPCAPCVPDNFVAKYSQTNGAFDWVVQSGSTKDETSLGLSLIGNGFGYVTGAFQDTAVFGAATITATAPIEMFIARVHDLGASGGAYERLSKPFETATSIGVTDEVNIYPNPTRDKLNIDLSFSTDTKTTIILCDLLGNSIKTIAKGIYNRNQLIVDTYNLSNGIYTIKIILPDKTMLKKFTVIK